MMKIKDLPKHGEMGHFCDGGCVGYAAGGLISKSDMNPKTETRPPKAPFPHLDGKGHRMSEDGVVDGYAEGGEVGSSGSTAPVEIPEEIKEFVEKAHKQIKESRPDENWRIKPAEKKPSVAPYKRDAEDVRAAAEDLPGYDAGGTVDQPTVDAPDVKDMNIPGYDEGGGPDLQPVDPDLNDLTPSTSSQIPNRDPVITPPVQAPEPPPTIDMANVPPAIPNLTMADVPRGTPAPTASAAPLTDQSYMDRANKMFGLGPNDQAAFLKLLGNNAQKGQIGAAFAGLGDAIASGGTLGKVNPGNLERSEGLIQDKTKQGTEGMQLIRGNQEKAFDVAQKLESQDPKSPLSQYAQKAYGDIGKKLGLDLSHAPASLIADVAGKGVEELNTEYQGQLKQMGLELQKEQVEATKANQQAQRREAEATRRGEAAKALTDRGILKTVANAIPGTAGHAATKELEAEAAGQPNDSGPVKVDSQAAYDALPSGTHYVDSFGTEKVKK